MSSRDVGERSGASGSGTGAGLTDSSAPVDSSVPADTGYAAPQL
ncbi:MAG TPA: hypothetical protein VLR71_12090 [Casimicrobiaceae bacterium]|nr:hypothetical protein [Casimicrobiaceae bacterium]